MPAAADACAARSEALRSHQIARRLHAPLAVRSASRPVARGVTWWVVGVHGGRAPRRGDALRRVGLSV
jgi:hypothetical protein